MFNSLSRRLTISGTDASPTAVLKLLLSKLVQHLGDNLVGHAKAIAHVDGGVFHASTTGTLPVIDVKTVGNPAASANIFQLDFMCVFHGLRQKKLLRAWDESLFALSASGLTVTPMQETESLAIKSRLRRSPANLSLAGSLASSFFVLKPCCLIPALWSISGGSIGVLQILKPLEPYRPYFMAVTAVLLAVAFFQVYFKIPVGRTADVRASVRQSRIIFWLSAVAFIGATLYPIVAPHSDHDMHHGAIQRHE
ncbi:MAG: hypothetical protein HYX63_23550 [Gammaproteobacteria bacterium]|nr:hypothetical protein [Gammaproteobacteria bacterium]